MANQDQRPLSGLNRVEIPVQVRRRPREGEPPEVVGVMTAEQLTASYEIPRRDSRRKTGYQREISKSRVNKLEADLITGRVDLPTAVLLNIREFKWDTHLVERDGQTFLVLNDDDLYVVDGQHRVAALEKLVQRDTEKWGSFEIPFACFLGADEHQEMEQFYVVNSTAKSVRTDLALDLLKQRAEADPQVYNGLVERAEDWKVEAQALTEALEKTPIWRGRIRFPGEPKGGTTIGSSGMVGSLKQLLATPFFGSISRENRLRILDAYWQGIAQLLPEVLVDPHEYTLQKSTGVQAMHALLIPALEVLRAQGRSVTDPEAYADLLREPLEDLEGDTASGHVARGPDFWRSGAEGAAGSFSSNAGRRVLTNRLRHALPEVDLEP